MKKYCLLVLMVHFARADGGPGNALFFGDSFAKVSVAHTNALNAYPLTVMVWFRFLPFSPPGSVDLVRKHDGGNSGWRLRVANDLLTAAYSVNGSTYVGSASGFSAGFVADGAWHHAALAVDASGGRLYLDGVLATSQPWVGTPSAPGNTQNLLLGGNDGPVTSFELGLDEVTVWNATLTQGQILSNRNRILSGAEAGLLAYYRGNETSGAVAADSAPAAGANDGTLSGPCFFSGSDIRPFSPYAETLPATLLNSTTASLRGVGNPNGAAASDWFEWGLTTNYGNATPRVDLGGGVVNSNFTQLLGSLTGGFDYQFRAMVSNAFGIAYGTNQSFSTPAFVEVATPLPGVFQSAAVWGDYDNDGRLDILLMGRINILDSNAVAQVWRNTGSGFTNLNAGLVGHYDGAAAWGDYDNDGRLDFLLVGWNENDSYNGYSWWRNTGNGFSNAVPNVYPVYHYGRRGSGAWGDFDNDGCLDFAAAGETYTFSSGADYQMLPWLNTPDGFVPFDPWITGVGGVSGFAILNGSMEWADFDNDGRLDLLVNGSLVNSGTAPNTYVFINRGSNFLITPPFTLTPNSNGITGTVFGGAVSGDFDNDGRLDVLVAGQTNSTTHQSVCEIWRNTSTGFTNINASLPGVTYASVAWGDFDNDGRLDVLLTGSNTTAGAIAQVWRNTGSGFTQINSGLPGLMHGSAAWGDYDNDGRLDILLTGMDATGRPTTRVFRNNLAVAGTAPGVPFELRATLAEETTPTNGFVRLSWKTPANGLTYNVRIGSSPGAGDVLSPMSAADGRRRLPQKGNADARDFALFRYTVGTPYYWSVQAVDGAYRGSAFAPEQSFRMLQPPRVVARVNVTQLLPGDTNGDGVVDQTELNTVLSSYYANSPWLNLTNVIGLGTSNVSFTLANSTEGALSVECTTNLISPNWQYLGPAVQRFEFTDTNASALNWRFYRLRWP